MPFGQSSATARIVLLWAAFSGILGVAKYEIPRLSRLKARLSGGLSHFQVIGSVAPLLVIRCHGHHGHDIFNLPQKLGDSQSNCRKRWYYALSRVVVGASIASGVVKIRF